MRNSEPTRAGRLVAMAWCNRLSALLILSSLTACVSNAAADQYPVHATVLRIIDASADPASLPPCVASRVAQLAAGKRFAALRYRRWASHFVATVYAEIPDAMTVEPRQQMQIVPAPCSNDALAVMLGPVAQ